MPEIYCGIAEVSLGCGQVQQALDAAGQASELARALGLAGEEGKSLQVMGQALFSSGAHDAALLIFAQSLSALAGYDPYEAARTQQAWGRALLALGNAEQGLALLHQAKAIFATLGAAGELAAVAVLGGEPLSRLAVPDLSAGMEENGYA